MLGLFGQRIDADRAHIGVLETAVRQWSERMGLAPQDATHVDLVVEELVTNVICHGRKAKESAWVELRIELNGDRLDIRLADNTAAFDPFAIPTPDLTQDIETRAVGGLGIHFVRVLMDSWRYERIGELNVISLRKYLTPAAAVVNDTP